MAPVRRIVLDTLKPHHPTILRMAEEVADTSDGVSGVNVTLIGMDREVENVKLTIEGDEIDYSKVKDAIENLGATVHSIDEAVCGAEIVEEHKTPQDPHV
ncbi:MULTISPECIES: DUF211 domain-containing protein [unclassified Haladaptatus]|uniref:DUF211 domain-containing protein n=1 Tax=unclassified Haladaptatus TaxID=2622732 RepID=UPI00209C0D7A|nr:MULTISPECIES: DUF211 domain-containing protein [unclassified Haladaptatus]MCO8244199.1 DUF211 domain-containing protein [Haladaptatus sp. AB643]MCO8256003.1 DUF211 domain-containing protein [Haladaptatus sp. AB618]